MSLIVWYTWANSDEFAIRLPRALGRKLHSREFSSCTNCWTPALLDSSTHTQTRHHTLSSHCKLTLNVIKAPPPSPFNIITHVTSKSLPHKQFLSTQYPLSEEPWQKFLAYYRNSHNFTSFKRIRFWPAVWLVSCLFVLLSYVFWIVRTTCFKITTHLTHLEGP